MCSLLKNFKATQENNFVKDEGKEMIDKDSANEIFNIYNVSSEEKQELYKIDFLINSVHMVMGIDKGVSIRVINYDTHLKLSHKLTILIAAAIFIVCIFWKCCKSLKV